MPVKGDNIRFYIAGYKVGLEMEVSLSVTADMTETSNKDNAGWKTFIQGDKAWTASGSAMLDWVAQQNVTQLFTALTAGTEAAIDIGSATNTKFYSGNGLITSWSFDGPRGGVATLSFEWQGTGALAEAASIT
jgi:predicted secreted protein